ncbi:hypothetical protein AB0E59_43240 [Lentzea sp. NPDC034063]|uniref:hypothetical protein n=1 Tax=unclassified Lentzea TaxID=2643253 RepID=UPI0033E18BF3
MSIPAAGISMAAVPEVVQPDRWQSSRVAQPLEPVADRRGREVERRYGVGWWTMKQALTSAWSQERKIYPPRASKLVSFKPAIDTMLREDSGRLPCM